MSQQLDSSAIKQIKDLVLSGYHLNDIHSLACPTTILPEGTAVASLERFALERYRFRGAMDTTSIDDFVRYSVGYAGRRKSPLLHRCRQHAGALYLQHRYSG